MKARRILIVTGTRAEYGLLRPVIDAVDAHPDLELQIAATGAHLLGEEPTVAEVLADWPDSVQVPMQSDAAGTRFDDARALGRGVEGFAALCEQHDPDVVLVLGDRIEALAAATAASVSGIRVAHIHGGDRAEGIADESMRHAISKLAHMHFPATTASADRLIRMGESETAIHMVGSPAMDGLAAIAPMSDEEFEAFGAPAIVVLMHPIGRTDAEEQSDAEALLAACCDAGSTAVCAPNHDPGRSGIVSAMQASRARALPHLHRDSFIGLLRRSQVIVGNSSAGLIEASALGIWCVNVGPRQHGRDKPSHVRDIASCSGPDLSACIRACLSDPAPSNASSSYGDGTSGRQIAEVLASGDLDAHPIKKCNTY